VCCQVEPFDEVFHALGPIDWEAACAWEERTGRDAAVREINAIQEQADALFDRMSVIPATTAAGEVAKVSTLIVHVLGDEWRGPARELEKCKSSRNILD
jgi:hypothetical protein